MLSAEEDELFDNLIKNVYGKLKGKQIKALKLLENDCCWIPRDKKRKRIRFLWRFKETTGYQIQHDVMNFFDSREINEKYREKLLKIIDELEKENAQLSKQS